MGSGLIEMEGLPLGVWAIISGIIIAGKFIYRWELTKKSAKYVEQRNRSSNRIKEAVKGGRMTRHKYDPQNFSPTRFRDYLRMRKNEQEREMKFKFNYGI
jgi:hypothetical protein